jgi:hypothetical protein
MDERPEGPKAERHRDEVRQGDSHAVGLRGEVVPQLVGAEDQEQAQRIRESGRELPGRFQQVDARVQGARPGRRHQGQAEEQQVEPGAAFLSCMGSGQLRDQHEHRPPVSVLLQKWSHARVLEPRPERLVSRVGRLQQISFEGPGIANRSYQSYMEDIVRLEVLRQWCCRLPWQHFGLRHRVMVLANTGHQVEQLKDADDQNHSEHERFDPDAGHREHEEDEQGKRAHKQHERCVGEALSFHGVLLRFLSQSRRRRSRSALPWVDTPAASGSGRIIVARRMSLAHSFTLRSLRAFAMTETELKLMAAPAMMGLSSTPKNG